MQWTTDWGLRGRMGLTMFLLVALYVVFLGVLVTFTNAGVLTIVFVMGAFSFVQYFYSDKMALYSMGAIPLDDRVHRRPLGLALRR